MIQEFLRAFFDVSRKREGGERRKGKAIYWGYLCLSYTEDFKVFTSGGGRDFGFPTFRREF